MFVFSQAVHTFLEKRFREDFGWGVRGRSVIFLDILSKNIPLLLRVKLNMIHSCWHDAVHVDRKFYATCATM